MTANTAIEIGVEWLCLMGLFMILWTIISDIQKLNMPTKIILLILFFTIVSVNSFYKYKKDEDIKKIRNYNDMLFILVLIILSISSFGVFTSSGTILTFGLLFMVIFNYKFPQSKSKYYYTPLAIIFALFNGAAIIFYNMKENDHYKIIL